MSDDHDRDFGASSRSDSAPHHLTTWVSEVLSVPMFVVSAVLASTIVRDPALLEILFDGANSLSMLPRTLGALTLCIGGIACSLWAYVNGTVVLRSWVPITAVIFGAPSSLLTVVVVIIQIYALPGVG